MDADERPDENVFENDPSTADDAWAEEGEALNADAEATQVLPAAEDDPEATAVLGTPDAPPSAAPVITDEEAASATAPDDEAAGTAPAASGRGRRIGLIVGLALLLVALAVGGWFWWDSSQKAAREQAVRDRTTAYLTALADADAAGALETLAEQPANTTLLTDEVLAASREAAAITDVAVGAVAFDPGDETKATADVTYTIGTQPVEATLDLTGDGRTHWGIADGLGDLTTTTVAALTVNGATLTETTSPVFPGTYTAASTNQYVTLNGTTTALLADPTAEPAQLTPEHALSEAGTQAVLAAVKGRFDECLASTETLPGNCPFGVDPGPVTIENNQVSYQLQNDPWAGFTPTLDVATLTASGTIHFEIDAHAVASFDGRTGNVKADVDADRAYAVNLTQDPLTVTWS